MFFHSDVIEYSGKKEKIKTGRSKEWTKIAR